MATKTKKRRILKKDAGTEKDADKQLKNDCENAVNSLLKSIKKNPHVVLFIGNGISEGSRRSVHRPQRFRSSRRNVTLSTKNIVESFVSTTADSNPRGFQNLKDAIKHTKDTLEGRGKYNMTEFMSDISRIDEMKNSFINHVVEECCLSDPNENHYGVLLFCSLLNSLEKEKPKITLFTTNYDNLIERAYLSHYFERLAFMFHNLSRKGVIKNENAIKERVPEPTFVLEEKDINECNGLPIVPIHGCIRICKCPGCGNVLATEATAIGRKRCVYCGSEVPNVIVPTTEGETDKDILRLLENYIKNAGGIIFVGYGFDDPHITDRINHGIEASKVNTVINCCKNKINPEYVKIGDICELNDEISKTFMYLNAAFKDNVDNLGKLIINANKEFRFRF